MDNNNYEWTFRFTLNGKCIFPQVNGRPEIELHTEDNEEDGTKTIQGFTIRVQSSSEDEAVDRANSQAKTLVDILAVMSGGHLGYTLTGQEMSGPDRRTVTSSVTCKFDIEPAESLDLNKPNILQAIKTREPRDRQLTFVDRLGYANEGLGAFTHDLYSVMIKQFHLSLGSRQEARKYDSIRDAVSHHEKLDSKWKKTRESVEKEFPGKFDWTNNDTLDYRSDKTRRSLKEIALQMRELAIGFIREELYR